MNKMNRMKNLVKIGLAVSVAVSVAILVTACGDITGDTAGDTNYNYDYSFEENNIDYGSGTVLLCNDSNCSVKRTSTGKPITGNGSGSSDEAVVGVYDEDYTPAQCSAAGFFYCSIQDKCLNQRVDDSSSSCSK